MNTINLNADMGESFGRYTIGNDEALLGLVKSASIACGFHAGDPNVMARAVRLATAHGVSIGAHPSFDDLRGFGRRVIHMPAREIENLVAYQIGALQGIAAAAGARVTHVKPHGALNNMAHVSREYADAIASAIRSVDANLIFVANACSEMAAAGERHGLRVAQEAYIDRTYDDDGRLTSRDQPDAIIHDIRLAVRQVLSFLDAGALVTRSGARLPVRIHTFCAHGDDAAAVETVRAVRDALEQRGVRIVPLTELAY